MAADGKAQPNAPSKKAISTAPKRNDSVIGEAVKQSASLAQNMNDSIMADEAAFNKDINEADAKLINEYMKMLEDKDIPLEKRLKIAKEAAARIDKQREHALANKRENSKRLKWILCLSTLSVLGIAALELLPDIVEAMSKYRKC